MNIENYIPIYVDSSNSTERAYNLQALPVPTNADTMIELLIPTEIYLLIMGIFTDNYSDTLKEKVEEYTVYDNVYTIISCAIDVATKKLGVKNFSIFDVAKIREKDNDIVDISNEHILKLKSIKIISLCTSALAVVIFNDYFKNNDNLNKFASCVGCK